jgi:hypothetical protein
MGLSKQNRSLSIILFILIFSLWNNTGSIQGVMLIKSGEHIVSICQTPSEISIFLLKHLPQKKTEPQKIRYIFFYLRPAKEFRQNFPKKSADELMTIWAKNKTNMQKYDVVFHKKDTVYFSHRLPSELRDDFRKHSLPAPLLQSFIVRFDSRKDEVSEIINRDNFIIYIRGLKIIKIL